MSISLDLVKKKTSHLSNAVRPTEFEFDPDSGAEAEFFNVLQLAQSLKGGRLFKLF
jgi:hypothetical protein